MALSYALDVQHGFTFTPSEQAAVGYLSAATVGGSALAADLTVTNQVTDASMAVVGVLSAVQWAQTADAALTLTAYISAANRSALEKQPATELAGTEAVLNFSVYAYAVSTPHYFCAFTAAPPSLAAVIADAGVRVAAEPMIIAEDLDVYQLSLTVSPPSRAQNLTVATEPASSVAMPWGTSAASRP